MEKLLLVLNAGSSSLKFSVFEVPADGQMRAAAVGQVEGLGTAPRLKVKDGSGESIADVRWDTSQVASHAQALQEIAALLRARFPGALLAGVGHRVVNEPLPGVLPPARPRRRNPQPAFSLASALAVISS